MNNQIFKNINQEIKNAFIEKINERRKFLTTGITNHCDHDKMILEGRRWNDNDRILRRIFDAKFRNQDLQLGGYEVVLESVIQDPQALTELVDKELESARYGDYHYTYEKEW